MRIMRAIPLTIAGIYLLGCFLCQWEHEVVGQKCYDEARGRLVDTRSREVRGFKEDVRRRGVVEFCGEVKRGPGDLREKASYRKRRSNWRSRLQCAQVIYMRERVMRSRDESLGVIATHCPRYRE